MTNKSLSVLILGGSKDQLPVIELAKSRGFRTIVADMNPYAPGLAIADKSVTCSTRDHKKVLAIAKQEQIDGITSLITESGLYSMYFAAKALGLPHFSEESVLASLSKIEMRKLFAKEGINDLPFAAPQDLDEARSFARKTGYPVVSKSSDTGGQLGLYLIDDEVTLEKVFDLAKDQSLDGHLILEKYAPGPEINVVFTVYDGKIKDLTLSDRLKDKESFGIVKRHVFPSRFIESIKGAIRRKCELLVKSLKLNFGVVFPQMVLTLDHGPVFLEIGVRVPGGIMNRLFECATGIDLTSFYLDICMGEIKPYEQYRTLPVYPSVLVSFLNALPGPLRTGVVEKVVGLDKLKAAPGIVEADYFIHHAEKPEVTPLKLGRDRFFYVISQGISKPIAHHAFIEGIKSFDFLDGKGKSLVKLDFDWDSYQLDTSLK